MNEFAARANTFMTYDEEIVIAGKQKTHQIL